MQETQTNREVELQMKQNFQVDALWRHHRHHDDARIDLTAAPPFVGKYCYDDYIIIIVTWQQR